MQDTASTHKGNALQSDHAQTTDRTFCGWKIAGGYATVSAKHVEKFKTRFEDAIKRMKGKERRVIIKSINSKINGFGNYYKHGNVKGQFKELDIFIRSLVRPLLLGKSRCDNNILCNMGLQSLSASIEALSAKMTEVIAIHKKQLHHLKILTASL